jgi:oxygen-independent coproporphyrinogen-3 oxidase
MNDPSSPIGLYIHVPFCRFMCHYCDFAKTANWDQRQSDAYFAQLTRHLRAWHQQYLSPNELKIGSIYIGGGTPGIFGSEWLEVFESLGEILEGVTEFTLEANPHDLTPEKLSIWSRVGINRLSIGVQSFQDQGLKFLTRDHTYAQCLRGLELASHFFSNINVDLIYGWQGQNKRLWLDDLSKAIDLGVSHLSLYNLIFESKTPLGRAYRRGRIKAQGEELQVAYYEDACSLLQGEGFVHEEVSNWAKPGFLSHHNHIYWKDGYYLGVGAGAHGYLVGDGNATVGLRYSYPPSFQKFLTMEPPACEGSSARSLLLAGLDVEQRGPQDWLVEYIGSSLRSHNGCNIARCEAKSGQRFKPSDLVQQALRDGRMRWENKSIVLDPYEWIRETAWSLALIDSFGL